MPFMCGEVTIDTKRFRARCSMHSSVLSNLLTKLHLMAETEVFDSDFLSRISCQSSGKALLGSTMYAFSTPSAFTFLMTVPIFLMSLGSSMTAIRFLHL